MRDQASAYKLEHLDFGQIRKTSRPSTDPLLISMQSLPNFYAAVLCALTGEVNSAEVSQCNFIESKELMTAPHLLGWAQSMGFPSWI